MEILGYLTTMRCAEESFPSLRTHLWQPPSVLASLAVIEEVVIQATATKLK